MTPLVRKLAAENGVDLGSVKGTGVGGRIRKQDVIAAAEAAKAAASAPAPAAAPAAAAKAPALEASPLRGQTVKMPRMRKVIGDNMMKALHEQAQLTIGRRGGHHPADEAARAGQGRPSPPVRASSCPRCRSS